MENKILFIALIALIVGAGGGYFIASAKADKVSDSTHVMPNGTIMGSTPQGMQGEMDTMMADLEGKTGDEFDKAFLAEMITHHEGAVEMAEAALKNAKHDEIKKMANAIISAQTAEIAQMKGWLSAWYGE